jgi:alanine dehydrogenase
VRIGVTRERTPGETRVALAPHATHELSRAGHRVLVEAGAGEASGVSDAAYEEAGARVVGDAAKVWDDSELVVKVYGPVEEERARLREGLVLLSFLSLPINRDLMRDLLASRCVAFAMETVRDGQGRLPILAPMSEIAGRLTPQIGAHLLLRQSGGRGVLLGGAAGVRPGRVVVLGCGIVGSGAARMASGLGAQVVVIDRDVNRLRELELARIPGVTTLAASTISIRDAVLRADLLIGAVHVVGCVETSRPTTLGDPTFVEGGVIHYCVKNVPAAVPVTATRALSNALLPHVRRLAGLGLADALKSDPGLASGAAVAEGRVVDPVLARATGTDHSQLSSVLPLHAEAR